VFQKALSDQVIELSEQPGVGLHLADCVEKLGVEADRDR
jgi:hypothetical protein